MIRRRRVECVLALVLGCAGRPPLPEPMLPLTPTPEPAAAIRPASPEFEYALPVPVVQQLENGLTVVSLERRALPFVEIELGLGAANDRGVVEGLAQFTARLLRHGEPDTADGGDEESGVDRLSVLSRGTAFHVRASSEELGAALESLSAVTRWPELGAEAEEQARSELFAVRDKRRATLRLLRTVAMGQLYGRSHPIVHADTIAQHGDFSVKRAREFHAQRYRPQTSVLSLVGALSAEEAKALAQRHFGSWKASGPPLTAPATFTELPPPGAMRALVLNNGERESAILVVAMPCVPLADPDGLTLDVAAMLLAKNQTSRAQTELRHQSGGTYSLSAQCLQTRQSGTFLITLDTAPDKVGETLVKLLAAAKQLGADGASDAELAAARGHLLGSTLARAASSAKLSSMFAGLYMDGQPLDYMARLPSRIRAVTAAEVRAVAGKFLDGTRVGVAIYGPSAWISPQLRELGAQSW